jgi:hypothetical protein
MRHNPRRPVLTTDYARLRPDDILRVYHGTHLNYLPSLINGFDATAEHHRHYGGPRHAGLFVAPTEENASQFGPEVVLEIEVQARFLHGTDYSGNIGRASDAHPERMSKAWVMAKYPASFRPLLSESLQQRGEPQALLKGLVSPSMIKRVRYKGKWYSRAEFLRLGLTTSTPENPYAEHALTDAGFDFSNPRYSLPVLFAHIARLLDATPERIEDAFFLRARSRGAQAVQDLLDNLFIRGLAQDVYTRQILQAAETQGEQPRPNGDLSDYFPETAAGRLQPRRGEDIFEAGGIGYIGNTDGSMVPIGADNLEAMPENIWDADKLSTLVEAAGGREQVLVYPGYADLWVEDGDLCAQVRDGNHRTFAAIEAGSDFAWVMMSDSTRQHLDLRETPDHDKLYRAIRSAQAEYGVPLFKRRRNTIRKGSKYDVLLAAEQEDAALTKALEEVAGALLVKFGAMEDTGYPLKEQLQRPGLFWHLRTGELARQHGTDFIFDIVRASPEGRLERDLEKRRQAFHGVLYNLRQAAGLKHAERLDPVTGLVTHW